MCTSIKQQETKSSENHLMDNNSAKVLRQNYEVKGKLRLHARQQFARKQYVTIIDKTPSLCLHQILDVYHLHIHYHGLYLE